jgi:hypothetical protein
LLSLLTQPLKQFRIGLVLELAMEVCFHVPNAPPALNIWPQWSSVSLCAALFHVIDCLQNTFVPIVYHTHSAHPGPPCFQALKEPVAIVTFLPLSKCNGKGSNYLLLSAATAVRICSFIFACEKSAIYANDRSTQFESLMQAPNAKNDH